MENKEIREGYKEIREGYKEVEGVQFWNPETENEELAGQVMNKLEGDFGFQWEIVKSDGSKIRTPSHKVLQNRMLDVKVGQRVLIHYEGKEAPKKKGNNPTSMYRVFVKE